MLMAEYDYEMDIEVHSQEAEARGEAKGRAEGRAAGRDEGKIEVYYTEMHLSVDAIAEKLSMEKETVRKILAESGILRDDTGNTLSSTPT